MSIKRRIQLLQICRMVGYGVAHRQAATRRTRRVATDVCSGSKADMAPSYSRCLRSPRKRTLIGNPPTSAKCHYRKWARLIRSPRRHEPGSPSAIGDGQGRGQLVLVVNKCTRTFVKGLFVVFHDLGAVLCGDLFGDLATPIRYEDFR